MVEVDAVSALAQLGAAGVIGWMWLSERRAAGERERQIRESHETLMNERAQLDVLVRALEGNTRAVTALEAGQRELIRVIGHAGDRRVTQHEPDGAVPRADSA